ncbi:MAG TPA: DUF3800 domain-containing protein [Nitrospirales bacterium]|nr:hypothetical protein [Nitrospiraceae bacterium]HNP61786.1 DUF3800 domain-containing protein [Nitrospirales bacterium]
MSAKSGKVHTEEQLGQPHNESIEMEQHIGNSQTSEENKQQKLDRERTVLLSRLAEINFEDTRTKVAFILNQYRTTRDSDIALTLKYWQIFHRDLLGSNSISFENFHKLPKFTSISRARAKIQNEYGLFQASKDISKYRANLDSEQRDIQVEDKPEDSLISIYCDESGKTGRYKIVASLWINDGYRFMEVWNELSSWKADKGIEKELHFTKLGGQDIHNVEEFFERVLCHSDALGFKAVILDSHPVQGISPEDLNFRLHYQLIVNGIEHEVQSGRFSLPRRFSMTKDKDDGADKLRLVELEQKLRTDCQAYFNQNIIIEKVKAEESNSSLWIQLADLFAASINRKLNSPGSNYKDEIANKVLYLLGIRDIMDKTQDSHQDFATILWI